MKNNLHKKISNYIQENDYTEDFSELLKSCTDYDLFYHLSDFRRSIVQWYPFKKKARNFLS